MLKIVEFRISSSQIPKRSSWKKRKEKISSILTEFWTNSDLNSSNGSVPRQPNLSTKVVRETATADARTVKYSNVNFETSDDALADLFAEVSRMNPRRYILLKPLWRIPNSLQPGEETIPNLGSRSLIFSARFGIFFSLKNIQGPPASIWHFSVFRKKCETPGGK